MTRTGPAPVTASLPARLAVDVRRPLTALVVVGALLVGVSLPDLFALLGATTQHPVSLGPQSQSPLIAIRMIEQVYALIGVRFWWLPPLTVLGVLTGWMLIAERRRAVHPAAFLVSIAEGILWAVPLLLLVNLATVLVGRPFGGWGFSGVDTVASDSSSALSEMIGAAAMTAGAPATGTALLAGVAAAIYEEFLFRLVLVSAAYAVLRRSMGVREGTAAFAAGVLSGVAFAAAHWPVVVSGRGDVLHLVPFLVGGVVLAWLFLFRGLAVVVVAHAVFNLAAVGLRSGGG